MQDVLQQQIQYYRERAGQYDEWFYRLGRYDRGAELNQRWFDEVAVVMQALQGLGSFDQVLELACGTGIWTGELIKIGQHVTALDASPEVIALNQARINNSRVSYEQVDLFAWQPAQTYDLVFFSFWLSHVPPELLDAFLDKVAQATERGGRVFLIDSRASDTSTAKDNPLRPDEQVYRTRKLNDGREFTIVKMFYEPDELAAKLTQHGLEAEVSTTDNYFIYASATRL